MTFSPPSTPGQPNDDGRTGRTAPWRTLSGERVADLLESVRGLVGGEDRTIHVGTDSKNRGAHTDFVVAVVVLEPGRGGRAIYKRIRFPRMRPLVRRLLMEVELSVEVAELLDEGLPQSVVLHLDANPKREHRSSAYASMLAGIGMGYGFKVMLKPEAWCATNVADHVVRGKNGHAA